MRNEALQELDTLIGEWDLMLSGAWYLDSLDTEQHGRAQFDWLDDAFIVMRSELEGEPIWDLVLGRSDAEDQFFTLYHDRRGVNRLFVTEFDGGTWRMWREDPDFHQRFIGEVANGRIVGRWEASEDEGRSWRKDFDLTFQRRESE